MTTLSLTDNRSEKGFHQVRGRAFAVHAVTVVALLVALGCVTGATPARKKFTAISDAAETVQVAMKVFNLRYQQNLESEIHREQILAGYAIYQKAALQAVADEKAGRTVDALRIINEASLPLLQLLSMFGSATP